jgi:hypothetical protein
VYLAVEDASFTFVLYYTAEFTTINSLPLQVMVSEVKASPGSFQIRSVFYAGSTFDSLDELVSNYTANKIPKVSGKLYLVFL